jgi:hypothetical protein
MPYDTGLVYSADRARLYADGKAMSQSDLVETLTVAGWVHDNAEALCIVQHESNNKPGAISNNNPGGPDHRNLGLFQIWAGNVAHPDRLLDPVYNANVARRIWSSDGGSFKQWATAAACANKSGFTPPGDEATPDDPIANALGGIGASVAGGLAAVLNGIPWFRVGKGALGFVLIVIGTGTIVVVIANKAPSPARAVRRAIR